LDDLSLENTRAKPGIIAVVDDDAPLREALGSVLKAAGFTVETYASAEEFLDGAGQNNTSTLILDVRLPGMSGIELQRHLVNAGSKIPIIFVTAHGDDTVHNLVMQAGAAAFLTKPVRGDRLLKEIHKAGNEN
jgi:FixJ family two-component response regulator